MPFINRCGDAPKLQTKTVTPTTSQQIITPDTGYEGLEKIIVNAPALQDKTVTADGTVTPDEGYVGIEKLTVNTIPNVYESTSSTWDYYTADGSIAYDRRKFALPGIADEHSKYPDIIYIPMPSGILFPKSDSDYHGYLTSMYIRRNPDYDLPLLSASITATAYRVSDTIFDSTKEIYSGEKYDCFMHHCDQLVSATAKNVVFNAEESCFTIGYLYDPPNKGGTTTYFLGTASYPVPYKAYFIWL